MDLTERTLESRSIFEGKIVTLLVDQAELPDGKRASREVVLHPGGVAVLPLDEEGNVTLVQQYRYPFHQVILELPAGKLDAGEPHETAARRELSEETGEPVDVDADDEEYGLVIMKTVEENGEELLSTLDSDEEIEEVYNLFMERFFEDEDE